MKKKSEERFEKVVEWEYNPCTGYIISGIALMLSALFILVTILLINNFFLNLIGTIVLVIDAVFGFSFFMSGLGKGKRVYYRKLK